MYIHQASTGCSAALWAKAEALQLYPLCNEALPTR